MKTFEIIGNSIVGLICVIIIFFVGKSIINSMIDHPIGEDTTPIINEQPAEVKPDIYEIHANATEGVRQLLKSPSTAKFPTASKINIQEYEPYNYRVQSCVDSQNGFGAVIRSNWQVEMQIKDGYVTYHDIIIQ